MKKRTFSQSTRVNFSVHCCLVGLLLSLAIVFSYLFLPLATSASVASGPSTGKAATPGQPVTQQPQAAPLVVNPGRLIFGVGGVLNGLLMTNTDGTNAVNLTDSGAAIIQHPSVSAQTGMIAFDAQSIQITPPLPAQDRRIFVMNGDGSGVRQITFVPNQANPLLTQDFNPEISPDGTKVAFISARTAGQVHQCTNVNQKVNTTNEVFVVNVDGTNLQQVTHATFVDDVNFGCEVSNNYAVAWSSDSQHLAVLGRRKYKFAKINIGVTHMYNSISIDDGDGIAFNFGGLDGVDKEPVKKARIAAPGFIDWSPNSNILFEANLGGANGENAVSIGYLKPESGPANCGVDGGGPGGGGGGGFADCTATQTLMGQIGFGGSTDGQPHGGQIFTEPGGVRYSPDGSGIVIAGASPLAGNNLLPTVFVGTGSNPILPSQGSGHLHSGLAWAPGPAIPTPNQLVLTPNPLVLYSQKTVPVIPTVLDAQGNVIVRAAVWHSGTAGFRCDTAPNQVNCSGSSLGAPDIDFTGQVTWKNREIVGNLCGENGLLRTCMPYFNSQAVPVVTVAASTPTASVHNATPGTFTITRLVNSSGALVINFSLSGTATRNADYSLSQSGNSITMASGQTTATINVQPTGNSFGSGDKTVIFTLQPDPSNTFYVDSLNNAATVTIKDDGPPPAAISLSSIAPNKGGDGGKVTVTIFGTNIKPGATVKLKRLGQADIAGTAASIAPDGTSLTAVLDLTGRARGTWDVVVTNSDNTSATLAAAFAIEQSEGPQVWIDIIGQYTYRSDVTQTFYFVYGNRGDVDAPPTEFRIFLPTPLQLNAIPELDIPGIGSGGTPLVSIDSTGTTMEFAVPKVPANSSYYSPFQLTAPGQIAHTDVQLKADSFGVNGLYDTTAAQIDKSATLTPEFVVDTDTYAKIVQHVSSATFSGSFTSEVFLTSADGPSDSVFNITNDGQNVRFEITANIPTSLLSGLTQATSASKKEMGIRSGTGWTHVVHIGLVPVEVLKTIKATKEAYEAYEGQLKIEDLVDCLLSGNRIDADGADRIKAVASGRLFLRVSIALSEGAGLKVPLPLKPAHFAAVYAVELVDEYGVKKSQSDVFAQELCIGGDLRGDDALFEFCTNFRSGTTEEREEYLRTYLKALAKKCLDTPQSSNVTRTVHVVFARDPNEKDGSQGAGTPQYVSGKEPLRYVISFENLATATAPAQSVVVTDQLDTSKVDLSTLSLGAFNFSSYGAAPLPGLTSYSADLDLRPATNLIARVNAQLDKNTGLLTWRFTSIDPATGQPTTNPLAGFLPPDKNAPEGQGSVTFSVMPKPNLATGTEIRNKARIVFDANAPIDTNEYLNTIDNSLPASHVIPLASNQSSIVFNVRWAGQDTGSGIQSYDIYVSENGGSFTPWLSNTSATSAMFIGLPGKTYSFYSVAHDGAANLEAAKTLGETMTATPSSIVNSIDDARYFVWQHYRDFLSRQPDQSGWDFWTNQITQCGNDTQCIEVKRINVSAAFFLSIEFQETGYLAYLTYKESYGNLPGAPVPVRLEELLPDSQEIGNGVVVGQTGWEQVLESNKQAFMLDFVQRSRFTSAYPTAIPPAQLVDTLYLNAGVTPSASDRTDAINEFGVATTTADSAARARVLRRVTGNAAFRQQEFNRAFVLMQYFGYLRRNPSDAPEPSLDYQGYNFWLTKLNQFGGNFVNAEMVKAFIVSGEYRQRFGP
jgi:hypothetical protein